MKKKSRHSIELSLKDTCTSLAKVSSGYIDDRDALSQEREREIEIRFSWRWTKRREREREHAGTRGIYLH